MVHRCCSHDDCTRIRVCRCDRQQQLKSKQRRVSRFQRRVRRTLSNPAPAGFLLFYCRCFSSGLFVRPGSGLSCSPVICAVNPRHATLQKPVCRAWAAAISVGHAPSGAASCPHVVASPYPAPMVLTGKTTMPRLSGPWFLTILTIHAPEQPAFGEGPHRPGHNCTASR